MFIEQEYTQSLQHTNSNIQQYLAVDRASCDRAPSATKSVEVDILCSWQLIGGRHRKWVDKNIIACMKLAIKRERFGNFLIDNDTWKNNFIFFW